MDVCIVGTGYVGLVTGACLSFLGHNVVCVDTDEAKIASLDAGISPIYEPGIEELIKDGQSTQRLKFSTTLRGVMLSAEVIFIAVGTPSLADGTPDLRYVKSVAEEIGRGILENQGLNRHFIIINKSTVPVGCGCWVEMLVREQIGSLIAASVANGNGHAPDAAPGVRTISEEVCSTFTVVSNPEFLREGSAINDTLFPDRIVVGASDSRAVEVLKRLYAPLINQSFEPPAFLGPRPRTFTSVPFVATDVASAEMIKYAANAFLATKISFANEIANICEHTGADIDDVMNGIGLDNRIGVGFLKAGVGWGGSCFGKDVAALIQIASEYNYRPELLEAARVVNARQRRLVVQKLQRELKIIKGRTIGVLGLSFKSNTDDVRDTPSFDVLFSLLKMGARVKVYDPVAMPAFRSRYPELDVIYCPDIQSTSYGSDALVIVTEWDEFKRLDLDTLRRNMNGSVIVDGRNIIDVDKAQRAGFKYVGIGRGDCR